MRSNHRRAYQLLAWLMALSLYATTPLAALAQTRIVAPSNKYSISDDIKLGQQAAAEVEQQMPLLRDPAAEDLVGKVGRRLVAAIPPEFQHPEFRYTFKVVNARDINAFALPGGYMYVNRGMIEAARNEGEMAGVMAHELSHVALRHGTAQATKAQSAKFQLPALGGAILGAIIGGGLGSVVAQGSQAALGTYFLKFSREYETQADVLGAQIMARAGYDPRDLANMFRTIEQQSGGGGGGFFSDHPSPANRYQRIMQEAAMLRVNPSAATQDTRQFQEVQARLRGMPRAPSSQEIAQSGQRYPQQGGGGGGDTSGNYGGNYGRVNYPSGRYRAVTAGNFVRLSVPDNWRDLSSNNSMTFAPEGAYGQSGITHGVMIGVAQAASRNLQQATDQYISGLLQGNPYLRQQQGYQRGNLAGRNALGTVLAGTSNITGRTERVTIYTTFLSNGDLFYVAMVAPQNEYRDYQGTFSNILRSIQLND